MVICQKFDDNYENVTTNRDEFMKELRERCGDTCRYEMKPDEVEFFAAQSDGQKIRLHWLDGDTVKSSEEKVPDGMEKLWDSEETNNIGLAARFPDDKGGCILAPLSQLCKLSLEKSGNPASTQAAPPLSLKPGETVFICYEENSVALYPDAGNVNRMFATSDIELAKEWAARSIENAKTNGYRPYSEEDYSDLTDHIGEEFASVWVYRDGNTNSRENYGICVDAYSLTQGRERLDQLFA